MSVLDKDGVIVLGNDTVNPQNNITIKTPAVADGSLEVYQGVPGNLGDKVFRVDSTGVEGKLKGINLGTAKGATGTAVDFDVPVGVKRVGVSFYGVSLSGNSNVVVQLGTSAGFQTTGYASFAGETPSSSAGNGFICYIGNAARALAGVLTIYKHDETRWTAGGELHNSVSALSHVGSVTLVGGELTRIRVTTVNGTDQFDGGGTINVSWEL